MVIANAIKNHAGPLPDPIGKAASIPNSTTSRFSVEAIFEPNLAELASFFATQTGDSAYRIHERLNWQLRNPSRTPDVPFAWYVRTAAGKLAGAMLCIPHRLTRGLETFTALMSSGFYVDASIRGAGVALFLHYRAMSERYVLYATTTNAQAARVWQWAGAKMLAATNHELVRPLRWSSLAEEVLVRRLGRHSSRFVRAIAPLTNIRPTGWGKSTGELLPVESAADAVTPSMDEDVQPLRDASFIRWRFFDVPQVMPQVYRYRQEKPIADGFVALTRLRRGYRHQVRALFVADIWGSIGPSAVPGLLDAISMRHKHIDDVLVIRCFPQRFREEALAGGFVRHEFDCATGWYIDHPGVLGPDPVLMPTAATELV